MTDNTLFTATVRRTGRILLDRRPFVQCQDVATLFAAHEAQRMQLTGIRTRVESFPELREAVVKVSADQGVDLIVVDIDGLPKGGAFIV